MWRRNMIPALTTLLLFVVIQPSVFDPDLSIRAVAQTVLEEEPYSGGALGTSFTYQGGLSTAGGPVTGACDFRFGLFDAATGGSQIGLVIQNGVSVTNGLFIVSLDFGANAFNGLDRFLETSVRCPAGSGSYTTLTPRQRVAPTPYAMVAESASSSRADFTVNGKLWVLESASFGGPGTMGAITLRSPDLWIQADTSFGRGDGGRALTHEINDTLSINHLGDFAGGVAIGSDTRINGSLDVQGAATFGPRGSNTAAITLRAPDLYLTADSSFGRGDGGRALAHAYNDTLDINHHGDFTGGVVIGSKARIDGNLDVQGWAALGNTSSLTAVTFRAPDLYLNADGSFDRGAGGRAIVHDYGDVLSINHQGDFDGGVKIWGNTVVQGSKLQLNGFDFIINGGEGRGDGGRAFVHAGNDTLIINLANDFAGGVRIESDTRIEGSLTATGDFTAEGHTIRLMGTDFYMNGGADRGDGGRALVHDRQDTLVINYGRDFAGGVKINDLRTGKIIEENLMTPAQQADLSLLPFEEGDVLCWDSDRQELTLCTEFASPLVVGVADEQGKPIVLGAEQIKVIGVVQPGDLLVASQVPGYATAWSQVKPGSPPTGVVVAKALQRFEGDKGMIKAMIFLR